ncbi:hypothetical protein M8J76_007479 [Diaphorina citri]|nr:hypothetical protein M8J76_007479 [Diaphorina citri]
MATKRKSEFQVPSDEDDLLSIRPLGAGQEVGRSCIMLEFKNKSIMRDCGIHPGLSGMDALPFVDLVESDQIDLLLIITVRTLAKTILSEPEEVIGMSGQRLPLKMSVDYISFSAHTDYQQTSEFVRELRPAHVVQLAMISVFCAQSIAACAVLESVATSTVLYTVSSEQVQLAMISVFCLQSIAACTVMESVATSTVLYTVSRYSWL